MTIPNSIHVYSVDKSAFCYFATGEFPNLEDISNPKIMKSAAAALQAKWQKFSQMVKRTDEIIELPPRFTQLSGDVSRIHEKVLDIFFMAHPMNLRLEDPAQYESSDRQAHIKNVIKSQITYQTFMGAPKTIEDSLKACDEIKQAIADYCKVAIDVDHIRDHVLGPAQERSDLMRATGAPDGLVELASEVMLQMDLGTSSVWNEGNTPQLKKPPKMDPNDFSDLRTIYTTTLGECEMDLRLLRSPEAGEFLGISIYKEG